MVFRIKKDFDRHHFTLLPPPARPDPIHTHTITMAAEKGKQWFPLEANPEVMNKYCDGLGFKTDAYEFADILALEDWALDMVPGKTLAVLLLFPIKESTRKAEAAEREHIEKDGQAEAGEDLLFMKQYVGGLIEGG